jgi:hypothetical protein
MAPLDSEKAPFQIMPRPKRAGHRMTLHLSLYFLMEASRGPGFTITVPFIPPVS